MRTKYQSIIFVSVILIIFVCEPVYPHSGGLDSNGGHNNRKTGQYHYHRKEIQRPPTKYSPSIVNESEQYRNISEYFRGANEGVGALDCNVVIYERDVSQNIKENVKSRDGYRCVICGSTYKLEVDHKRALMNGGSNSLSNLATLCDDCHTKKTRMDNSLRRKRQRICRGR